MIDETLDMSQLLIAYYAKERKLLEDSKPLVVQPTRNGELWTLPIGEGEEIPVAVDLKDKDMIIQSGDVVTFKANPPSGPVEEVMSVGDLKVDGKREIQFYQKPKPNGYIFKLNEAAFNHSAAARASKPTQVIVK